LILWNKSQIANRKSQTINNYQSFFDSCTYAVHPFTNLLLRNKLIEGRRDASRLYMILIMICISINTYAQGTLNITLLPKTYLGNYNISCNGANNGEIDVLISGGVAPYSLLWSHGPTANPLLNLGAGTYKVIVTDANNAVVIDSITLIQPPALGFTLEVSSYGEYNLPNYASTMGFIKVNPTGGNPSYTVVWNDNNTELIRDSLAAAAYTFVLTDANGCTANGNKTLTQPAQLTSSITLLHGTSCFEGDDGAAEVSPNGGIAPYSYLWDNGSFSASPQDLTPGWHIVHITDDANNRISDSVNVTQASEITAQVTKSTFPNNYNVSCYNCFNGTLSSAVSGGTAPYTYNWIWEDNSIGTSNSLSNLGGGDYELIVLDNNQCKYKNTISLKEPERQDWGMSGNAGTDPATQFIGTTDSVDVVLRSNNVEQIRLGANSTKITSGNLLIGDSLGINGFTDSSGTKVLHFGERSMIESGPFQIPSAIYCGQSNNTINLFDASIFIRPSASSIDQPHLSLKADGNNASIEVTDGNPITPDHQSTLLINNNCGRNVWIGNENSGDLIARHRLGVGSTNLEQDPLTIFQVHGKTWLYGNVHIGSAEYESTTKLAVHGKVFAREVIVTDSPLIWPDYVFDENYKLTPLDQLSEYLKHHKHLPEIPATAEVAENGISVGEITPLLLKKIEELTLHVIQQQKEIENLKLSINELKK
jgi:hypothetical protein